MIPTVHTRLLRAAGCRSDLHDSGIDIDTMTPGAVGDFVRLNLDYFQSMLGYDAGVREVTTLLRRTHATSRPRATLIPSQGHRPPAAPFAGKHHRHIPSLTPLPGTVDRGPRGNGFATNGAARG